MKPHTMNTPVPETSSESIQFRIAAVRRQVAGIARILAGSDNRMVDASAELLAELAGDLAAIETDMMQKSAESPQPLQVVSAQIETEKSSRREIEQSPLSADESSAVYPSGSAVASPVRSTRKQNHALQKSAPSSIQTAVSLSLDTDTPSVDTSATRSSWTDAEIQFLRTCPSSSEAIRLFHLHFGNAHNDSGIHQRWLKLKRTGEILSESTIVEVIDTESAFSGRKGKIINWTDSRVCANFQFTDDPGSYQIPARFLRAVAEGNKNL